jgi:hypothetical protein
MQRLQQAMPGWHRDGQQTGETPIDFPARRVPA